MKKIAYILFLSLFLVSCGESELVSEEENINEIIIENTDEVSVEVENEQIEEEMTKEQEQIAKNNEEKKNDNTLGEGEQEYIIIENEDEVSVEVESNIPSEEEIFAEINKMIDDVIKTAEDE